MKDFSWLAPVAAVSAAVVAIGSKVTSDPLISVTISGVLIMFGACIILLGHTLNVVQMYQWFGRQPGMSIEAGLFFLIIGAGKITMATRLRQLTKRK